MVKVAETNSYDIYELTKTECRKEGYVYPCFSVYMHGETDMDMFETHGMTLDEVIEWCES